MVRETQREFHCEEGAPRAECLERDDVSVFKFDRPLALTIDLAEVGSSFQSCIPHQPDPCSPQPWQVYLSVSVSAVLVH